MYNTISMKKNALFTTPGFLFVCLMFSFVFASSVSAEGVFDKRKKDQHQLSGADLNRIKAEHQIKFGSAQSNYSSSFNTNNPWEKKKNKAPAQGKKSSWGECRDYALHKRNRCYREGRDAYRCEQMYETRADLCDDDFK